MALGGGEFTSRLIAFVATAYLAVVLGPEHFGILGFAFAVISYLSVFLEAGFVDVGSRDVARRPDAVHTLASSLTIVRLIVAAICFVALTVSVWILDTGAERGPVLIVTGLLLFAMALDTAWAFKGLERGVPVSLSLILRRLVYALLVFVFIGGPEHVLAAPMLQFVGELVGVLWLGHHLLAKGVGHIDLALGWRTFRSCASLMSAKLLRTSIIGLDVVLLGLMATDRAVGLYSAPYRFCFFLMAIAGAIQVAYLPHVGRSVAGDQRRDAARRHLEISAALGIPLAAGGAFLAGPIIDLIFGADYIEGTVAFRILLWSLGVLFLFAPLHNVLLAQDRLRWEFWGLAVAALLNLVLNVMWIPVYGIVGAAWATLIAETVILVWAGIAVWSAMGMALLRPLLPPCVASGVMLIALMALPETHPALYISVPVGAAVYIGSLVALRRVPEDATSAFRRLVGRFRSA